MLIVGLLIDPPLTVYHVLLTLLLNLLAAVLLFLFFNRSIFSAFQQYSTKVAHPSKQDIGVDLDEQRKLLNVLLKSLRYLQIEAAKYGGKDFAPLKVRHQLDDTIEQINACEAEIKRLETLSNNV